MHRHICLMCRQLISWNFLHAAHRQKATVQWLTGTDMEMTYIKVVREHHPTTCKKLAEKRFKGTTTQNNTTLEPNYSQQTHVRMVNVDVQATCMTGMNRGIPYTPSVRNVQEDFCRSPFVNNDHI